MLTSTVQTGADLVEAVLDGAPDSASIAVLRQRLTDAGERHGGVRVLVEVRRYEDPSSPADQRELRRLGGLPEVRRLAVVSPDPAFRAAAQRLLSFVPVESRVLDRRDEARAWLDA